MRKRLRRLLATGPVVLALLTGLLAGMMLGRYNVADAAGLSVPVFGLDLRLISEAWDIVQGHYVQRSTIDAQKLTYGAIGGMVAALGDTQHSIFLSPDEVRQEQEFTSGALEGIGAQLQVKDDQVVIAAPLDGSPASRAGLRAGEAILDVDGQDVSGQTLEQVIARLKGPAGTSVALTLIDPATRQTRTVKLVRARIVVPSVTWQMLPGTQVAQVRVAAFSEKAGPDLQRALAAVQKQHAQAIILDLRNNPGGLVDEAVGVASQFLYDGDVFQEKDADGNAQGVAVRPEVAKTRLPVMVLVNRGTASAAEIVAGALQDAHRARLVGETTFGAGTVLNEFSLSDGSALNLAVKEWLTRNGRAIWHQGIKPDVVVALPAQVTPLTPAAAGNLAPDQLRAAGDAQLQAALDLLTQPMAEQVSHEWFWPR